MNISRIGQGDSLNTTDRDGGFFGNLINGVQGDLNGLITNTTNRLSAALNLPDFYAVYVMNFCEGSYQLKDNEDNPVKNTIICSNRDALFHFDITQIVEDSLPDTITLNDIHWLEKIAVASRAIKVANIVMVVFYAIAVAFTGLTFLGALYSAFSRGTASAYCALVLGIVGPIILHPKTED